MVNIEINGQKLQVRDGAMVIEAADEAGITIPRFCYHKKLSVAANCRMCLVEVAKVAKPLPACATPVTDGMVIKTKSPLALDAQKSVMEFLLINHPLDCPICDQGGECDLQDIAMGFGKDISRYAEEKRVVTDKNIGPLVATEMTRCIHCTRCVRFGQEIAGIMELGATGRGEHTRIGTYVERAVSSELSGNIVDLCPVGALTSKPYRYTGRPWENKPFNSIAAHDCIGSNTIVEVRRDKVMRVLPRENEALNEIWLSDRDRFSYLGLYHEQRLQQPMIKQGDSWKQVDWQAALSYASEGLKTVLGKDGAEQLGALLSPSATVEEMYLLQKLVRGLGSNNIDHRLRQMDFNDQDLAPRFPWLGQQVAELASVDAALLIGSWIRKDQPIAAHRLRQAALKGARIMAVNSVDFAFNFPVHESIVSVPAEMVNHLAAVAKALLNLTGQSTPDGLDKLMENVMAGDAHLEIAKQLHSAENATVLLGTQAMLQPQFSALRALANVIAANSNAKLGYLADGANASGGWLTGSVPHRAADGSALSSAGKHAAEMLGSGMKAFVLLNVEPEYDSANPAAALHALDEAEFVVSLTPYVTESMQAYADVLLPICPFTETEGTLINAEGQWQSFSAAVSPLAEARPAWKVLRVLGNVFGLSGFEYVTSNEVLAEARNSMGDVVADNHSEWRCPDHLAARSENIPRIGLLPIYGVDGLVRRATALQQTADGMRAAVYMNSTMAKACKVDNDDNLQVTSAGNKVNLRVYVDDAIPDNCVLIPQGVAGSEKLGAAYDEVSLGNN